MVTRRNDEIPPKVWIGGTSGNAQRVFDSADAAAEWAATEPADFSGPRWVIGPLDVVGRKQRGRVVPVRHELYIEDEAVEANGVSSYKAPEPF